MDIENMKRTAKRQIEELLNDVHKGGASVIIQTIREERAFQAISLSFCLDLITEDESTTYRHMVYHTN